MILLDSSNILIYATLPEYDYLRKQLLGQPVAASVISRIEAFGYPRWTHEQEYHLENMFSAVVHLPITNDLVEIAIRLRKKRRMSLGDAIVAATALEHGLDLWTRNLRDFSWINGLMVHNPIA